LLSPSVGGCEPPSQTSLQDAVQGVLKTKVISTGGSNIVDKAAMHKALVLVLTQDTKKGLIDTSGGGSGWGPWEGFNPFYTFRSFELDVFWM